MDIRIDVEFFTHPKTIKLERRLGLEAVKALMVLWTWAARNRPDGDLIGMENEDIEIAAGWTGEYNKFAPTLNALGWLDGEPGQYSLHSWQEHNPWVAESQSRSAKARLSRMANTHPVLYLQLIEAGATGISREHFERLTASNTLPEDLATSAKEGQTVTNTIPIQQANDRITTVNASLTPSPTPSPTPNDRKNSKLSTELCTDLSTELYTYEDLISVFKGFPGYEPSRTDKERSKERGWLLSLRKDFSEFNLLCEMNRALGWIHKHKNFKIQNARAFFVDWLKKTRKMKEQRMKC